MMRRRISFAVAMLAASVLGAGCGGSSYSSESTGIPVTGVTIEKAKTFLLVGNEELLAATVVPAAASEKRVQWSTNNDKIVKVTAAGKITGVGEGTATVTVTTVDGGKTAHCDVTVTRTEIAVTGVALDLASVTLDTGTTKALKATVAPSNATNQALTWDIQPTGIANLSVTGSVATITGLKPGNATVTVTSLANDKASATATVTVSAVPVTGVALSQTELAMAGAKAGALNGDQSPLTATIAPSNATDQVTWTTSDAAVATLTSTTGSTVSVVAHAEGKATITVTTSNGKTATCVVTVKAPAASKVDVTGVGTFPTANDGLAVDLAGKTGTVTATVSPFEATDKTVYWRIADPTVATISPAPGGTMTGDTVYGSSVVVKGAGFGATTLTVTTVDQGKMATIPVNTYLLDADIDGTTATGQLTCDTVGNPAGDTVPRCSTAPAERTYRSLIYYADAHGFRDGGAGPAGGIELFWYGNGTGNAKVGVMASPVKSYVAIPADLTNPPLPKLKISVTASKQNPGAKLAVLAHNSIGSGRAMIVQDLTLAKQVYPFNNVPGGIQIDLANGGPDNNSLIISHVRVEPDTGPGDVRDLTVPADVTGLTAAANDATSVKLSWTNPANKDFDHVEISYGSNLVVTGTMDPSSAGSYVVSGLTSGVSYTFTVTAVDKTGNVSNSPPTVNGTPTAGPAPTGPLLDETFTKTLADAVKAAATGTPAKVTVSGSKLAYFTGNSGGFEWRATAGNNTGRAWFASWGVYDNAASGLKWPATVGGTPPVVKTYVTIPTTAFASPTSGSLKVTIQASQYQSAYTAHHLLVLDQNNKVIAIGPALPAGSGDALGGSDLKPYVVDGVRPNTEIRITSDQDYLYLGGIKVETSATAATDTPAFK